MDTRSDVYSLGVLLYELLTGGPPFSQKELATAGLLEMLRVVREQEPPRPSVRLSTSTGLASLAATRGTEPARLAGLVRGEVDWIVMKALAKDRGRRYETATGLAADVRRHLDGEPVQAVPPSVGYRLRKWGRKNRAAVTVGGLLLLAAAVSSWQAVRAERARVQAVEQYLRAELHAGAGRIFAEMAGKAAREATREKEAAEAARQHAGRSAADAEQALAFLQTVVGDAPLVQNFGHVLRGRPTAPVSLRDALDKAEPKLADAFAGRPLVEARVRLWLSSAYQMMGDWQPAFRQMERAYALRRQHLGPDSPETRSAQKSLAEVATLARPDVAVRLFEELLSRATEADDRVELLDGLALIYEMVWQHGRAAALRAAAVALRRQETPPDPHGLALGLRELGDSLLRAGRAAEAEPPLRECVRLYEAHRPDDWFRHVAAGTLGRCLLAQRRYADARLYLEASHAGLRAATNESAAGWLPDTLGGLAELAAATGRPGEAAKWRAERAGYDPVVDLPCAWLVDLVGELLGVKAAPGPEVAPVPRPAVH